MRVVSLVPSATEIVALVAGADVLVGRSHECDYPPAVKTLPALTGQTTTYDPASGNTAAAIDAQVRSQVASGAPLYTLNARLLAELQPDLIVTQALCNVCSIDAETVHRVAQNLGARSGRTPEVLSLDPHSLDDVLDDILSVGKALNRTAEARDAVVRLNHRLLRAQEFVNPYEEGPVLGFLEWTDPPFVAGHWNVQLIERAGATHPLNPTKAHAQDGAAAGLQQSQRVAGKSIRVSPETFARVSPEALVIAPCGLSLDQARAETAALARQPWFASLPAVKRGRVAIVDGNQMFNRPGPRLVDAFEWLVGWLHNRPELIPEGFPWEPWAPAAPN